MLGCIVASGTQAATYYIDASQNTAAISAFTIGSVGNGTETQVFTFAIGPYQPGDIIDFGTVTLGPQPFVGMIGAQYGPGSAGFGYSYLSQNMEYGEVLPLHTYLISCSYDPNCWLDAYSALLAQTVNTLPITYTVGTSDLIVQFGWAFGSYHPPAPITAETIANPLPATWLMFLTGGLLLCRAIRRTR
jgi:hypothetical protein